MASEDGHFLTPGFPLQPLARRGREEKDRARVRIGNLSTRGFSLRCATVTLSVQLERIIMIY